MSKNEYSKRNLYAFIHLFNNIFSGVNSNSNIMVWAFKNVFCNFDWALVKKNVDFLFYPKTAILTYGS